MEFNTAIAEIWTLVSRANKYIDETAPWVLAKEEEKRNELESVMIHLAESLRIVAILLQPVMTETPGKIFEQLGLDPETMNMENIHFGEFPTDVTVTSKGTPIFPRLEIETEVTYIQRKCPKAKVLQKRILNGIQKKQRWFQRKKNKLSTMISIKWN